MRLSKYIFAVKKYGHFESWVVDPLEMRERKQLKIFHYILLTYGLLTNHRYLLKHR